MCMHMHMHMYVCKCVQICLVKMLLLREKRFLMNPPHCDMHLLHNYQKSLIQLIPNKHTEEDWHD